MPTIDLTNSAKEIQLLSITAIMYFPSEVDEDQRTYWSLKQWTVIAAEQYNRLAEEKGYSEGLSKHIGSWFGEIIYHLGSWPALANTIGGPGYKKYPPAKEAASYVVKGLIAGSILDDVLKRGVGLSAAVNRFCNDDNNNIFKSLGIKPPIMGYQHIHNKIWPQFKDAAHLWASWLKSKKYIRPKDKHRYFPLDQWSSDELKPSGAQGLDGFIKLSNYYRELAIKYIPSGGRHESLLDEKTTWRIIL